MRYLMIVDEPSGLTLEGADRNQSVFYFKKSVLKNYNTLEQL